MFSCMIYLLELTVHDNLTIRLSYRLKKRHHGYDKNTPPPLLRISHFSLLKIRLSDENPGINVRF